MVCLLAAAKFHRSAGLGAVSGASPDVESTLLKDY